MLFLNKNKLIEFYSRSSLNIKDPLISEAIIILRQMEYNINVDKQ